MMKHSTVCAGIDIGKLKLDVALTGSKARLEADNTAAGHDTIVTWLKRHNVDRIGVEATGGYEKNLVRVLRRAGFVVVVLQPLQVRSYAQFRLKLAKNDKIDAAMIAACVASVEEFRDAPDPRFEAFAAAQTLIDQLSEDIVLYKTRLEMAQDETSRAFWKQEIANRKAQARSARETLREAMRAHVDLAAKLDLIVSVQGIAEKSAIAVLVRMPEIGTLSREQVAALAGLAPYDDDSGTRTGPRHIMGGRTRLRTSLYAAAFAATFHWNPHLKAFYARLRGNGKTHKMALVACARKLLIFINTVVARGTPWQPMHPAS
ncbi:IS110 family transposase [Bradyrhizobium sp. NAS96.2]|uniref:IS110 family transposase n=1 Tax=Bradyrhizobium sp. NAS96.2 TaxID=1680160 RepID=UPI00093C08CB|nr:IS110 family transposase [Bradyrhizobium sp. NAS96.2]OKO66852.1 transposase [Bradyrhizobium sp. NAS96.2]